MQKYTSAGTSMNRTKLPKVYGKADFRHSMIFDYGCGKFTEHIREYVFSIHKGYLPYDPYNQPDDVNASSATLVINAMRLHMPVDVVCSNVLNVIDDDEEVRKIARHLEEIAEATRGTAYVTVYEGDKSGNGRRTGADQYQRNEPIRAYLRFFRDAVVRNGMIIIDRSNA